MTIKDSLDTAGTITTWGTPGRKNYTPTEDDIDPFIVPMPLNNYEDVNLNGMKAVILKNNELEPGKYLKKSYPAVKPAPTGGTMGTSDPFIYFDNLVLLKKAYQRSAIQYQLL